MEWKLLKVVFMWALLCPLFVQAQVIIEVDDIDFAKGSQEEQLHHASGEQMKVSLASETDPVMRVSPTSVRDYLLVEVSSGVQVYALRLVDGSGGVAFETAVGSLPFSATTGVLSAGSYVVELDTSEGLLSDVIVKE